MNRHSARLDVDTVLDRVLEFSVYNADKGTFIRTGYTKGPRKNQVIGSPIGYLNTGYRQIELYHQYYFIHQLVWAIEIGDWPHEIDHIDGDTLNNHISNLRDTSRKLNTRNRHKRNKNNTSGFMGVSLHKPTGKYQAYVNANGKRYYTGLHTTPELAHQARLQLIAQHPEWGFTEAHG